MFELSPKDWCRIGGDNLQAGDIVYVTGGDSFHTYVCLVVSIRRAYREFTGLLLTDRKRRSNFAQLHRYKSLREELTAGCTVCVNYNFYAHAHAQLLYRLR